MLKILANFFRSTDNHQIDLRCPDCNEYIGSLPVPQGYGYAISFRCIWCYLRIHGDYGTPDNPRHNHRQPPFILVRSELANADYHRHKPRMEKVIPQADGTWVSVK